MTKITNHICRSRDNTRLSDIIAVFNRFSRVEGLDCDPTLLWVATHSVGERRVSAPIGAEQWVADPDHSGGWWDGYRLDTVELVEFRSASSGSTLLWRRDRGNALDVGTLTFTQGYDPSHLGSYWQAFNDADALAHACEYKRLPQPNPSVRAQAALWQAERDARRAQAAS